MTTKAAPIGAAEKKSLDMKKQKVCYSQVKIKEKKPYKKRKLMQPLQIITVNVQYNTFVVFGS